MRLALYEPDIAQNTGTMLRMAACFGVSVDLIEPAGFALTDRGLRRAGLDYLAQATLIRHESYAAFADWRRMAGHRLILLTTRATTSHVAFQFTPDDILMVGRESAGVPDAVHADADGAIRIPMLAGMRSLNVALSAAIGLSEALRQTGGFAALAEREGSSDRGTAYD
jgi:tRNA (cytidine/uridine-2'-O-)-methyltransferase